MELDTKTDIEFVAFASEGGLTIPKIPFAVKMFSSLSKSSFGTHRMI